MYFVHKVTGKVYPRLQRAVLDTFCPKMSCNRCPVPNHHRQDIFPEGIAPIDCSTFMDRYPLIAAEYCECDVVLEPGDEGFKEQTDISSVDIGALNALLGG